MAFNDALSLTKRFNVTESQSIQIENLLNRYQLKKTELRISILKTFINSKNSLSQANLISNLEAEMGSIDRVSVYRNLNQLKNVGLVHEVANNNYIGCTHDCGKHPHLLLFCDSCHKHSEIKDHNKIKTFFEALDMFKFFGHNTPVSMKGLCKECSPRK